MRRVSILAAAFFALAWCAVAQDADTAKPPPPSYWWDAPRPSLPSWTAPATNPPPAVYAAPTLVAPPLAPTAATWQIHRTDSDTLLLNTATGESWVLDRTDQKQYKWRSIARDPSLPTYGPGVVAPAQTVAPAPERERTAIPPSQEFQTR
jgi:hypothetical protein